jgi:hypothetical protein
MSDMHYSRLVGSENDRNYPAYINKCHNQDPKNVRLTRFGCEIDQANALNDIERITIEL